MFKRHEKKKSGQVLKDLVRLAKAETIFEDNRRKLLMEKIENTAFLEAERFNSLCKSLIYNLANYCQLLPDTNNRHYAHAGGFMDYALNRTESALTLFKRYIQVDAAGQASEEQKLWVYALLSAALLQGVGKFYTDLQVDLYDSQGHFLRSRNALSESLNAPGVEAYTWTFQPPAAEVFKQRLNSLIARFLMPASGFDWICSNPKVLETWLALLNEDFYRSGTLGFILDRAKMLALQQHYLNLPKLPFERQSTYGAFPPGQPESLVNPDYLTGTAFIHWLHDALAKGEVTVDSRALLIANGGLLVTTELFKQFVKNNPHYKSWPAVQNGFLALGLHRLGLGGEHISSFDHAGTQKVQKGILFADYGLALPNQVKLFDHATGKSNTMSALELTACLNAKELNYLNPEGLWEKNNPLQPQKGLSNSGG